MIPITIGDYVKTNKSYEPETYHEGLVTNLMDSEGDIFVEIDNEILIYECYLDKLE